MSCPLPVLPLDPLIIDWPRESGLFHIYKTTRLPIGFNPGIAPGGALGGTTRFAPFKDDVGRVVPYIYAGACIECAIFETIFHNTPLLPAGDYHVDLKQPKRRVYARCGVHLNRNLTLVDLTSVGLERLRLFPPDDPISSPPTEYHLTVRWAEAIHHQCPDVDGLIWMARRWNRQAAFILFGDRTASAVTFHPFGHELGTDVDFQLLVTNLGLLAKIDISC